MYWKNLGMRKVDGNDWLKEEEYWNHEWSTKVWSMEPHVSWWLIPVQKDHQTLNEACHRHLKNIIEDGDMQSNAIPIQYLVSWKTKTEGMSWDYF